MSQTALLVKHRARPGKRDEMRRVWERFVKARAEANPDHVAYFFCFDNDDPDVVCAFQVYRDEAAMKAFLGGAWYPEYLDAVGRLVEGEPELTSLTPVWVKG